MQKEKSYYDEHNVTTFNIDGGNNLYISFRRAKSNCVNISKYYNERQIYKYHIKETIWMSIMHNILDIFDHIIMHKSASLVS